MDHCDKNRAGLLGKCTSLEKEVEKKSEEIRLIFQYAYTSFTAVANTMTMHAVQHLITAENPSTTFFLHSPSLSLPLTLSLSYSASSPPACAPSLSQFMLCLMQAYYLVPCTLPICPTHVSIICPRTFSPVHALSLLHLLPLFLRVSHLLQMFCFPLSLSCMENFIYNTSIEKS